MKKVLIVLALGIIVGCEYRPPLDYSQDNPNTKSNFTSFSGTVISNNVDHVIIDTDFGKFEINTYQDLKSIQKGDKIRVSGVMNTRNNKSMYNATIQRR